MDYEDKLRGLIKDATKMVLQKPSEAPKETHLKSHFGGQPYFEKGEQWPTVKDGNPLEFVFQVFNTGNISLPENVLLSWFVFSLKSTVWRQYPEQNRTALWHISKFVYW